MLQDSSGLIVSLEVREDVLGAFTVTLPIQSFPDSLRPNGTCELVVEYDREVGANYEKETAFRYAFVTPSYIEPDPDCVAGTETAEDGGSVTLLRRVPDSDGISVFVGQSVGYDEASDTLQLRCVSENGLALPVYGNNDMGTITEYTHSLYTQYARSGEIYALELSGTDTDGVTRVFETRYFRIADDEDETAYPEFAVSIAPVGVGAYGVTVECVGAEEWLDANGEACFTVTVSDGQGNVWWSGVSGDFAAEPVQTVGTSDIAPPSVCTVTFGWAYGESAPGTYTVGSVTVTP